MENIVLLGAVHEHDPKKQSNATVICGSRSDTILKDKWLSTLEKSTLIIAEGSFNKNILSHTYLRYDEEISSISRTLFESDYGPDILFADTRFRSMRKGAALFQKAQALNFWCDLNFDFAAIISQSNELSIEKKFLELIEFTLTDNVQPKTTPELLVRQLASEVFEWHKEMEAHIVAMARKYQGRYDQVLVVAGAAHTASIHRETNWLHQILFRTENIREEVLLYTDLLKHAAIPQKLRQLDTSKT